jgi:hypothetical protein
MPLASCKLNDIARPEDIAAIEQAEQARDAALVLQDEAEARAKATAERLKDAVASGNSLAFDMERVQLMEELEQLEAAIAAAAAEQADVQAAFTTAKDNATVPLLSAIAPFVPAPLKPFIPLTSTLVLPFLFPRGRQNIRRAVKGAAKGNAAAVIRGVLGSVGAMHTAGSSEDVLKAAAAVLRKENVESGAMEVELADIAARIRDGKIDAAAAAAKANAA